MIAGHLRKGLRFGGVGLVTAHAERGRVGLHRFVSVRVVRVRRQRTVARFAGHLRVLALRLLLCLLVVAGFAGFVPGKGDGPCADIIEGPGTVVSIPSESDRDDGLSDSEEHHHEDGGQYHQADQMLGFPEDFLHGRSVRCKPSATANCG